MESSGQPMPPGASRGAGGAAVSALSGCQQKVQRPLSGVAISVEEGLCLVRLVDRMNQCTGPTTFDLRGQTYSISKERPRRDGQCLTLSRPNITVCNGVWDLDSDVGGVRFCVSVPGTVMDNVTVRGGRVSVWVLAGGMIFLCNCRLIGAEVGALVGQPETSSSTSTALLSARDTLVSQHSEIGIHICQDGEAQLNSCTISDSGQHGVLINGLRVCKLRATGAIFRDNKMHAIKAKLAIQVQLMNCVATGNGENKLPGENILAPQEAEALIPMDVNQGASLPRHGRFAFVCVRVRVRASSCYVFSRTLMAKMYLHSCI